MPNLKVLPNTYQRMMEQTARIRKAFKKEPIEFNLLTHYPNIAPIYNRVGHYKLGNREWLEFIMPDGTFRAIEDAGDFEWEMDKLIAKENAMDLESFEAMTRLVNKGFLPESKQFINERHRRNDRKAKLESRIWSKGFKERLKAKIAIRKAEKENEKV